MVQLQQALVLKSIYEKEKQTIENPLRQHGTFKVSHCVCSVAPQVNMYELFTLSTDKVSLGCHLEIRPAADHKNEGFNANTL
jgi:hypothetical protein